MSLKKDLFCPHCHGRKLWHIEKVHIGLAEFSSLGGRSLTIPVALKKASLFVRNEVGHFETFICATCRYAEWYACGIDELKADPKRGIHFIDNEPQAGLR